MHRRLLAFAAGAAALFAQALAAEEPPAPKTNGRPAAKMVRGELEPKDVNAHLDRIPRKLPHVVRRREDLYEGAKHGLIVIRQIHWADGLDEAGAKEIARCQEEIRDLLKALLEGGHIDSVHAEGVMAAGEPRPDPAYSTSKNADEQGLRDVPKIAEVGAVEQVYLEKGLVVKGAEKTAAYDAAGPALSMPDSATKRILLYEDRENALLDIVLKERDRVACTVYGAAHDWEWNVEDMNLMEWNKEHPDQVISLLTLTVRSVADYDRKRYVKPPLPAPPPPEPLPPKEPFTLPGLPELPEVSTPPIPKPPEPRPGTVTFPDDPAKKPLEPFIGLPH